MAHKARIVAYDPFPGRPLARLARRRLLSLAGSTIDALVVAPGPDERDRRAAVLRCRRAGVQPIVEIRPVTPADAATAAAEAVRGGFAGALIATSAAPAAVVAIADAARAHLPVLLRLGDADLEAIGPRLAADVEVIWRPGSTRLSSRAIAAAAVVLRRAPLIELPDRGDGTTATLDPPLRLQAALVAGAGGVVLHPPAFPESAAIWLDVARSASSDALLEALDRRFGPRAGGRLAALGHAAARWGTPAELLRAWTAYERGDAAPLRGILAAWRSTGDAVARIDDRRLARELAPIAALLHALGEAGLHALDGDVSAAWEIYDARLEGRDAALGPAASALLELIGHPDEERRAA